MSTFQIENESVFENTSIQISQDLTWWWDNDQFDIYHDVNRQWQLNVLAFLGDTFNLEQKGLIWRWDSL